MAFSNNRHVQLLNKEHLENIVIIQNIVILVMQSSRVANLQ